MKMTTRQLQPVFQEWQLGHLFFFILVIFLHTIEELLIYLRQLVGMMQEDLAVSPRGLYESFD